MDAANSSLELLAHFDDPAKCESTCTNRSRGVGWVFQWSAAITTLLFAACLLTQFGYRLAAELTLARAARAGALEATLPRASCHSVRQSVERRLEDFPQQPSRRLRFSVQQNGAPVRGMIRAGEGDRLTVTLAVPTQHVAPQWLGAVRFWWADAWIEARAERQIPVRQLSPAR